MSSWKIAFSIGILFAATAAFSQAQHVAQVAGLDASQSASDLFGKAMWAGERGKFAEERSMLQEVMESYPDSSLAPRAKFEIANAWYNEGNFKAAEAEYRDFVAFFPQRPEASQARLRIFTIAARGGM